MNQFTVTFLPDVISVPVEEGTTLLQAQIAADLHPDAPCGGKGTCGKCKVILEEKEVLACQTPIHRDRDIIFHDIGLNDVVITKGAIARIAHLAVKCDGVEAMQCGGDGIIVATPTGSTAYSLSAGGPIVEPEANNILITPICAHDMMSRCVVASDRRMVTVELTHSS